MSAGAEASQEFIQGDFVGWQPEEHWECILDRKVLTSRRVTPFPRTDSNQTSRWPVKINQVLHQCMMSQLEQLPWQPLWMEIPSFFSWNQSETLLSVNSFAANQGGQQAACSGLTLYDSGFFFLEEGSKHPDTIQIKTYEQYSMINYAWCTLNAKSQCNQSHEIMCQNF